MILSTAFALLSSFSATLPQGEPTPWLGCWVAEGSKHAILFEPGRCVWARDGEPTFYRAHYGESGAKLERWARVTELGLKIDSDGRLELTVDGDVHLLAASDSVPVELRLPPYELPQGVEVDAATVEMLGADLRERVAEDQRVRNDPSLHSQMIGVDRDNTDFLLGVIQEVGWIDATRFGSATSDDAFLIVQHSPDLRLMCTALPLIEADVRAGKLGGQSFALLYDRVQLNLGHPQRYGSQLSTLPSGETVLMPCEDRASVDERRSEFGMGPLSEYLDLFRDGGDTPPIRDLAEVLDAED